MFCNLCGRMWGCKVLKTDEKSFPHHQCCVVGVIINSVRLNVACVYVLISSSLVYQWSDTKVIHLMRDCQENTLSTQAPPAIYFQGYTVMFGLVL